MASPSTAAAPTTTTFLPASNRRSATSKDMTAEKIFDAVMADMLAYAPPSDDVSLVVIKRT